VNTGSKFLESSCCRKISSFS